MVIVFAVSIHFVAISNAEEVSVYDTKKNYDTTYASQEVLQFNDRANACHMELIESWNGVYPEYYAGAYIDNGKLNILVTCDPHSVSYDIMSIDGEICVLQKVNYSYNYLRAIYEEMNNRFINDFENDNLKNCITGWFIDEIDNCITVTVCSNESIDSLVYGYFGYDSNILKLEYVDQFNSQCSFSLNAGYKDWVMNGSLASTLGCCAYSINAVGDIEKGFIIAGHAGDLYDTIKINGQTVGFVSARMEWGYCDIAFVNMNDVTSDYDVSSFLSSYFQIADSSAVGIVGTMYESHGMENGIQFGTVSSTSATVNYPSAGVTITDTIAMNITAGHGDSGAPLVGQLNGNARYIVGVLSGGSGRYMYYTKFTNIERAFNLWLCE